MKKKIFNFIVFSILFGVLLFIIKTDFVYNKKIIKDPETVFFPSSPLTSMMNYSIDIFINNMSISVIITSIFFGVLTMFLLLFFLDFMIKEKSKKFVLLLLFLSLSSIKVFSYYYVPGVVAESSYVHYASHPASFIFTSLLYIALFYYYLKDKVSVYFVYLAYILALLFYAEAIILLPSLLFVFFIDNKVEEFKFKNIKKAILSIKFLKFLFFCFFLIFIFLFFSNLFIYNQFKTHLWERKYALVGDYLGGSDALLFINMIKEKDYICCDTILSIEYFKYIIGVLIIISFYIVLFSMLLIKKELRKNIFINFLLLIIFYYLTWVFFFNPESLPVDVWWMYTPVVFFGFILFSYLSRFYETKKVIKISIVLLILNLTSFVILFNVL